MLLTLDKVIAGCEAVCKCIKAVLGELTDDQVYFDTRQGFSKDYMSANGVAAFMPLSSLTFLLNNTSITNKSYIPNKFPGTTEFKLMYGVRGVLCGETSMKFVPGMKDILARHNESSDAEHHMTEAELAGHVQCSLQLLRYIIDAKHIVAPIVNSGVTGFVFYETWAAKQSDLLKVITMTESTHQNEQRLEIVNHIGRGGQTGMIYGDRATIRSSNIIDMNLTPININALRREMPLMNLYNYSYTFDRMICDLLEVGPEIIDNEGFNTIYTNTPQYAGTKYQDEGARKLLAWLTVHPYSSFNRVFSEGVLYGELPPPPPPARDDLPKRSLPAAPKSAPKAAPKTDTPPPPPRDDAPKAPSGASGMAAATEVGLMAKGSDRMVELAKRRPAPTYGPGTDAVGDDEWVGGAVHAMFNNELASIMNGYCDIQGLGVPKFLADQLWNKVLLQDKNGSNPLQMYEANSGKDTRTTVKDSTVILNDQLSQDRFDTRFVRHMFWMVNLQRLLRLKMSRDLMWHTTKITKDIAVLAPGNTETFGKEVPDMNEENYKY